jgi:polysaccharide biosynthesis protein PslH
MRILFVTPYLPSPPHFGAQRRLDGLMRGLSLHHEVSLLSFCKPGDADQAAIAATREYVQSVTTVPYDVLNLDLTQKRLLQLRSLTSVRSFETLLMRRPAFQAALDFQLENGGYDVVQVEFSQMGSYRLSRREQHSPVFVLDEHNIEYDLTRRTAQAPGSLARKLYSAANWRKLRSEERKAWQRFDGVVLTSDRDAELLRADLPGTKTAVVPNGVDVETFRPRGAARDPATLLFLGAINYYPNTEGILHFLDHTWPLITAARPDVRLQIVGMDPPESVLARRSANVDVTGFVEDPLPYLERASVVIVPLRIGGGTRFKVVEALSMGKPIVSTRLGAEGIDVVQETHALLADDAQSFSSSVLRLLGDAELGDRLGRAARQLAEEHYSWRAAVTRLETFYAQLGCIDSRVRLRQQLFEVA